MVTLFHSAHVFRKMSKINFPHKLFRCSSSVEDKKRKFITKKKDCNNNNNESSSNEGKKEGKKPIFPQQPIIFVIILEMKMCRVILNFFLFSFVAPQVPVPVSITFHSLVLHTQLSPEFLFIFKYVSF